MRMRASEAATLPIGEAIQAASRIVEGTLADSARTGTLGSFVDGFMMFLPGGPPGNSYEYQKKRLTKFAFRKCLILKGMSLAEQDGKRRENVPGKKKSGSTPNIVIYVSKYITD